MSLSDRNSQLLRVEEAAQYLGADPVTIQKWCRDGALPCSRIDSSWYIRWEALEKLGRRSERSDTLTEQLRMFFEVPDNVLAISQDRKLMRELDLAFFRVGEARGAILAKYYDEQIESAEELRSYFEREGLEVPHLEEEGRFRLVAQGDLEDERVDILRRLMDEEGSKGRSIWANFNLVEQVDLDEALRQQEQLAWFVKDKAL